MTVEKGLTERFVNLIQTPGTVELGFQDEIAAVTPDQFGDAGPLLRPVRPDPVTYMPMVISILGPKIEIDTSSLESQNLELSQAENDPNYAGEGQYTADGLLETAEDYQYVLDTLQFMEPLVLYINPADLNRSYNRQVVEQFTGKGTHIVEHWGEQQDTLTANGRIGATYTDKTGLTRYFRRHSASYQQLMTLFTMYRNNGYLYEVTDPYRIGLVGRIQITFDTETWIGHFDSFTMTENAENPFTMEYSFQLTVREYYNDPSLGVTTSMTSPISTVNTPGGQITATG